MLKTSETIRPQTAKDTSDLPYARCAAPHMVLNVAAPPTLLGRFKLIETVRLILSFFLSDLRSRQLWYVTDEEEGGALEG